jgi:hypothetical protein
MQPRIFDIDGANELFSILDERFKQYCADTEKNTEDLIFIVMMATHLREWIAPKYGPKNGIWPVANSPAKEFSRKVYDQPNFSIIRQLCNGAKHAKSISSTGTRFEPNVWAWKNVWAIRNVWAGPPICHLVDDQPIESVLQPIMDLYRGWFKQARD